MVDFKQLLSKPADQAEKPKAMPAGTYYGTCIKYEYGESKEKKTPLVRFFFRANSGGDDIPPEDLEGIDLTKKNLRKEFYFTPDSEYRLREFLEGLGVETKGRSWGESIPDAVNTNVLMQVTQRSSPDGKDIYAELGEVKLDD